MARQPAKSAPLLLATLATLLNFVTPSDYYSVSVDTSDINTVNSNYPKFGDRISPRHRYSAEDRTSVNSSASSGSVRDHPKNITHLHRLSSNEIGRKSDEYSNEIDPIFADNQIESNVSSAQAHRLEMSTEFFVVPPTVPSTSRYPSVRSSASFGGMILTAKTTSEAASGNITPPTIVPTHSMGLRKEPWVVPVLILSSLAMIMMVAFEVFVLCKVWRTSPSRRHLFLGQMLLLGLFACAGLAAIVTSTPTVVSCAIVRFGSGVAFALVFASLLVKCVFLISLNGGVYLPAPYQGLLLLFAVLIQVAVYRVIVGLVVSYGAVIWWSRIEFPNSAQTTVASKNGLPYDNMDPMHSANHYCVKFADTSNFHQIGSEYGSCDDTSTLRRVINYIDHMERTATKDCRVYKLSMDNLDKKRTAYLVEGSCWTVR